MILWFSVEFLVLQWVIQPRVRAF